MQRDRDSSFLRIGSLNVKVKSTREAFGYLLGKSNSSTGVVHKNWGSADNLPEVEVVSFFRKLGFGKNGLESVIKLKCYVDIEWGKGQRNDASSIDAI